MVGQTSPQSRRLHILPPTRRFSIPNIITNSFKLREGRIDSVLRLVMIGSTRYLGRLALACLALTPVVVAVLPPDYDFAAHKEAMARQSRFQKTGKLARRADESDGLDDFECTKSIPCKIGCCGAM